MPHDGPREPAPLRAGDLLGPYRVLERVAEGGMGSVHRAQHVRTGAVHALKVVRSASAELCARFLRESEAMARVEGHPGVLRIHASGQEGGWLWLAMEWAPGGSLQDRLAAGPLALEEVVALGRGLAAGLAHVHARGVLHRDLKPANVLYGADGLPRLGDFGLARFGDARLTETGALLGTPAFMAPEQVLGAPLDERTDVHGLGAVLYTAATGRPPFEAASPITLLSLVAEAPRPDLRRLRPEAPRWLAREVLRAMSADPDHRHPSARALAEALVPAGLADALTTGRARHAMAAVVACAAVAACAAAAVGQRRSHRAAAPDAPSKQTEASSLQRGPQGDDPERVLEGGDPARALALATASSGDEARWVRVRALLALERAPEARALCSSRPLPRAHRKLVGALLDLATLQEDLQRAGEQCATWREALEGFAADRPARLDLQDPYRQLAQTLERLGRLDPPPAETRRSGGVAGATLVRRLQTTVAALAPELARLCGAGDAFVVVDRAALLATLLGLVGAAPDLPEGRGLLVVVRWLRWTRDRHLADRAALLSARADPFLPPEQRRLAELATLLEGVAPDDPGSFAAQEERLGQAPSLRAPLSDAHRQAAEALCQRCLDLAWLDPARRERLCERVLRVTASVPDSRADDGIARHRATARLLRGEEPTEQDLSLLRSGGIFHRILQAERLLGRGDWRRAAETYRAAIDKLLAGRRENWSIDGWTGLALALEVGGDRAGSARALADLARLDARVPWLPWRSEVATAEAIACVRSGSWRPTPGRPFPPEQTPR